VKNTYIKLFIGILLFATWITLVVCKVPDAGDIIGCIKLALAGLGVYHMADSRDSAQTAPERQGGSARPGLLASVALSAILLLPGCTAPGQIQSPAQATQVNYTEACAAYGVAFAGALELRRAGRLSKSQIDQVTLLDSQVTPICTGQLPVDATAATQQVTAAVTTLTILEVAHQEN
jgi:hypothetical protein